MISGIDFGHNYCRLIDPEPTLLCQFNEILEISDEVHMQYQQDLYTTEEIIRSEKHISAILINLYQRLAVTHADSEQASSLRSTAAYILVTVINH